ncbi:hypothetical protein Q0Z83_102580 [Actinoplanes sichuanensis]|uniref:SMODS and SLOG-associating 2TM effector domain-containing protein n=1 Tax=Actinoplanes sichuanensis TaxID=512349 RepID=A0ABW4AH07_9ACTN|nr:hypothetical protein [Actinoplanes sichuanensis]BEL12067.1 hypothetical protein Q0Z83_102580 [Actinoplanes sichuanensis]
MTRSLVREDPFSGEARPRLAAIDRDLAALITDAQSRDWSADRPDRVVFARLGQARRRVRAATGRRGEHPGRRLADPAAALLGTTTGLLTAAALLSTGLPEKTLKAAGVPATAVVALWVALLAVAGLQRLRRHRDRTTVDGPAPIDDHYRYVAFRRRIEACAAMARDHRSHRRRAAAIDLEYALDWLAAAQSELPRH